MEITKEELEVMRNQMLQCKKAYDEIEQKIEKMVYSNPQELEFLEAKKQEILKDKKNFEKKYEIAIKAGKRIK